MEKKLGPFTEVDFERKDEYFRILINEGDDFELCIGKKRDIKKAESHERALFVECLQYTKINEMYRKNFPNLVEIGQHAGLQHDTFYEYMFNRGKKTKTPQISILMRLDEEQEVEELSEEIKDFLRQFRG